MQLHFAEKNSSFSVKFYPKFSGVLRLPDEYFTVRNKLISYLDLSG